MNLRQKIISARNQQGLTQEELANLCSVTVRTIQRIESGDSIPRNFTLKALASALNVPFEELKAPAVTFESNEVINPVNDRAEDIDFLKMLCLSCFSYLIIPYLHFLLPAYLFRKQQVQNLEVKNFAGKVIRQQVLWVVLTTLLLLITFGYNFIQAAWFSKRYLISYVTVFFVLYGANAILIMRNYRGVQNNKLA